MNKDLPCPCYISKGFCFINNAYIIYMYIYYMAIMYADTPIRREQHCYYYSSYR